MEVIFLLCVFIMHDLFYKYSLGLIIITLLAQSICLIMVSTIVYIKGGLIYFIYQYQRILHKEKNHKYKWVVLTPDR